jgi:hypothetical protein
MCAKRLERFQRDAVAQDVAKRKGSYEQIAKRHSTSPATVSRIAAEYGVGARQRNNRTAATDIPEETYDSSNRKAALDRLMNAVDTQVAAGGQSSKQLLDLARAAREISSARAKEDKLGDPDNLAAPQREKRGTEGGQEILKLVELTTLGVPKHLEIYFAALDIGVAREAGEHEKELEATGRLLDSCSALGFKASEVDVDAILAKIDRDFDAHLEREEARKQKMAEAKAPRDAEAPEYNGEGLA